jgi:hypothetical protein
MEDLFEKDGEVYKSVPAGGHGGGVTSFATVKASEAEAAAFRAAQESAAEPSADEPATSLEPAIETEDPSKLTETKA